MTATSWLPPNLSEACEVHTTITNCSPSTLIFLNLIATLFGNSRDDDTTQKHHFGQSDSFDYSNNPQLNEKLRDEYDFIVVGAGSAGCVVANRLTEIHNWRVLLLEAGSEEPEVTSVPSFAPTLQRSSIDWAYMTQPSHHSCLARPQQRCYWARGKVMGGSSSINYMIYIRGGPEDYDEWAEMGNHDWSYEDVLPYFKKSEHNENLEKVDEHYHGHDGYLSVGYFPYQDQNIFHFIDAFQELGLPKLDQNGEEQIGVSLLQGTQHHGERDSTNSAFIRPVRRKRENLIVQTEAHVTRLLIDPHTKTARGVEYLLNGNLIQAVAKKEVILSAGSINSPKILMLSGVGPEKHLRSREIKVIKDLPVGKNLQDHTSMDGVVFALSNKTDTSVTDEKLESDVYYYKKTRKGPLSATGPLQIHAMVQTKYEHTSNRADIQYSFDATRVDNFFTDPILTMQTNVNPLAYYDGIMIRPILLNPESRGYIELNDTDPVWGDPLIYPNTFSKKIDLLRIVEGVKQSLNLLQTHSLNKIKVRLVTTPLPACHNYKFGSDEYWACVAKSYTATIYHPVGTCKMGPKHDKSSVVDSKLKVHGIRNLRVIDASIMPKIPRGNTNAPTIMIAEKGSDYIKHKWLGKEHLEVEDYDRENLELGGHNPYEIDSDHLGLKNYHHETINPEYYNPLQFENISSPVVEHTPSHFSKENYHAPQFPKSNFEAESYHPPKVTEGGDSHQPFKNQNSDTPSLEDYHPVNFENFKIGSYQPFHVKKDRLRVGDHQFFQLKGSHFLYDWNF